MATTKFLFTKAALDKLEIPTAEQAGSAGYVIFWDTRDIGFGVQVRPTGTKTFILSYRNEAGRTRRLTIGRYGRYTVEQARSAIKVHNSRIVQGNDPAAEKNQARSAQTFGEVYAAYLSDHIIPNGNRETQRSAERAQALIPKSFHQKLAKDIRRVDVAPVLQPHEHKSGNYNLIRSYVASGWSWGQKYGHVPDELLSPVVHIKPLPSTPQGRRITDDEYRRVMKAINEMMTERRNDPARLLACLFVLFTGCRPVEATRIRRDQVNRKGGIITLLDHKTKGKTGKNKTFNLTPPVLELIDKAEALHKLRGVVCPYVFPRRGETKASQWMAKTWGSVAKRAGVDLDLRHFRSGYINLLDDLGMSESEVAGVTQHLSLSTIHRHYRVVNQKSAATNATRAALRLVSFNDPEGDAVHLEGDKAAG